MEETKTPIIVYAESTPNPATMKYVVNRLLLPEISVEYTTSDEAANSPLALSLFQFPFVKGVYITGNFITVSKHTHVEWVEVMNELREFIREFIESGQQVFTELPKPKEKVVSTENISLSAGETESKIIEILDEYIKPAVEQDGGEITFQSFENGVVSVILKGSCSGCPSSTLTLKAGIEQLLKRMVPGVEQVVAENG